MMMERRDFLLSEEEMEHLNASFPAWEAIKAGDTRWLLILDYPIPEGYNVNLAIAAIQIPLNYPMAALDMVYFYPAILRSDGKPIGQTESTQAIDEKTFQRWSRHYTSINPWNPMADSVITHLLAIECWLQREFKLR